jgi:hypothetical protein
LCKRMNQWGCWWILSLWIFCLIVFVMWRGSVIVLWFLGGF